MLRHFTEHPPIPKSALVNLTNYLKSPRDWCLSRQLWWGHRIPAFFVIPGSSLGSAPPIPRPGPGSSHCITEEGLWIVAETEEAAQHYAVKTLGFPSGTFQLRQDEDVLDTWFSSSLLPLLSVPTSKIPPISVMETGSDILFFWVYRMSMLYETLRGAEPYEDVSLHAMVVDSAGRKMSKSRGNVIDPLDVIQGQSLKKLVESVKSRSDLTEKEKNLGIAGFRSQFPKGMKNYGNDALRLALLR